MIRRTVDIPATPAENIRASTLTGIAAGMVFGDIIAAAPWIGGAIGCAAGFAIGWRFRHVATKPKIDESSPR
ncbi:MAG: hypothetical protein JSR66_10310 [Proteobacteria bacterium]|nr:hypothetical protein [Pseudomonadota bacterium]